MQNRGNCTGIPNNNFTFFEIALFIIVLIHPTDKQIPVHPLIGSAHTKHTNYSISSIIIFLDQPVIYRTFPGYFTLSIQLSVREFFI